MCVLTSSPIEGQTKARPLPARVNFPLYRGHYAEKFQAVIMGDTQPYTHQEVSFVRDSVVKEVAGEKLARFAIAMGDNVGDNLSLYPRYLSVMSGMQMPFYLVPGNHDMNYDAEEPKYAFETFKRYAGPTYYSFNYGKVHFVVLSSVSYPSPRYPDLKTYQGEISEEQMIWLENDLSVVPEDHLVVLSMHIPVVDFQDRLSAQHQVINREDLYALLDGRKALALGGHSHTLEHFLPGEEEEGWGQPTPIPQIVVGAACGSWWSADYDEFGIPFSYQRDGAPRGYLVFKFRGSEYEDTFKATGKAALRQINISFSMPSFDAWYDQLLDWMDADPDTRPEDPPVTIDDLPDQGHMPAEDLAETKLIANVWNATTAAEVYCVFDDHSTVMGALHRDFGDPFAERLQAWVFQYAGPLDESLHTQASPHLWACEVPSDLETGIHRVQVLANDIHGRWHHEAMMFEVGDVF